MRKLKVKIPKKKHPHYVVMYKCVDSDMYDGSHIAAVTHSLDEAKEKFKAEVIAEKQIIKDEQDNFNIKILTDMENMFRYSVANRFDRSKYYSIVTISIVEVN